MSDWRWPTLITVLVAHLRGDAPLVEFLGGAHVYRTVDLHGKRGRGIGYQRITDPRREVFDEPLVQWDLVAPPDQILTLEGHARRLLTADRPVTIGGVRLHMVFDSAREHPRPSDGLAHHSFDARYRVARIPTP